MHVAIATGLYPPEIGGPATFSVFFEKELKKRGIACTVVPFSSVRRLPKVIRHISYFFRVLRAIRADSVVLALDPVSVGLPALFASRVRGTPFFLRVGGNYAWEQAVQRWGFVGTPEDFSRAKELPFGARTLSRIQSYVARRARCVLVQSESEAALVRHWGVAEFVITIVPNNVEVLSLPTRYELRKEFGWGEEFVVISAGRFVPWKGFMALIDAVETLKPKYPDLRLLIAGDGPEGDRLRARAKKNTRVEFLGVLSREQLARAIKAADAFVLNTGYEGFSHQTLEAMALGTPVITTSIVGNADLAIDGQTAITVPFNDVAALAEALQRALLNPEPSATRARIAAERARAFTPERTFTQTCVALGISL